MNRIKYVALPVLIAVLLFGMAMNVSAQTSQPSLPSSFFGEIHISDNPPVAGSIISVYVSGYTDPVTSVVVKTSGANLVYNVNVPGEEVGVTPGGIFGDQVTFMFNGRILAVGNWVSGTNVRLNFHPPAANAGGPYAALVSHEITLNGSAVDWLVSDTRVYAWDLDADGEYDDSNSASPTTSFATPGAHAVGLRVTDGQGGQGTASSTVTVVGLGGLTGSTYDGTPHGITVEGIEDPLTYTVTYDGSTTPPTNARSYEVVVRLSNDASVSGVLSIAPAMASVSMNPASKVYGDTDPVLDGTLSGFVPADNVTAVYSRVAGSNIGSYPISAALSPAGVLSNYIITTNAASLTITPRPASVTPNNASKVFGDGDPELSGVLTNFLSGDGVTAIYSRVPGEDAGTYNITAVLNATGLLSNYALVYETGVFTITPQSITVTATPGQSKMYGTADPVFAYTCPEPGLTFSGALSRAGGENVGGYVINRGDLSAGDNYTIDFVTATFNITVRPITVTAEGKTKVYGDSDPAFTYVTSVNPLVTGDNFTGNLTRVAGEDVGSRAIGQGSLALSSNYAITYVGANLDITRRPVTVTANAQTKVYGQADPELTYQVTSGPLAFSDEFSGALTRVGGSNVGEYAIQQGTLALSTNYTLSYIGANLTITPQPITVTANPGQSKMYGTADPVFAYISSVEGLSFTGALTRAEGESVGGYAINRGDLSAGGNYAISFVPADFTITVRPITVTAEGKTKVYGDSDPAFTYVTSVNPLVSGDTFEGGLTRDAGENVGPHAITQGDLALSSNYAITYVGANLDITRRPASVTPAAAGKVFGGPEPNLEGTLTNFRPADGVTASYSRGTGEGAGTYVISATLSPTAVLANYNITYNTGVFTIDPKPITVTATPGQSKMYGTADPIFAYTSSDTGAPFTGALSRDDGEIVGEYDITIGTLTAGSNYALSLVSADFTITRRPITVTANPITKVFGAVDPLLTYTITVNPLAFSENLTGSLERESGTAIGSYNILQGTLAATDNYTMTFVPGVFTITAVQHNISLVEGWNLVSFNLHPVDTDIADVLAPVAGSYDLVYAWDGSGDSSGSGNWLKYDNIPDSNDSLDALDETMGFWIHMTAPGVLQINGSFASTNVPLYDNAGGWNLVAYPSATNGALPAIMDDYGASAFNLVYAYQATDMADHWRLYDKLADPYANDLTHLLPGLGYWVHVSADGTWTVAY